jgi:hypothetical protein
MLNSLHISYKILDSTSAFETSPTCELALAANPCTRKSHRKTIDNNSVTNDANRTTGLVRPRILVYLFIFPPVFLGFYLNRYSLKETAKNYLQ